MKAYGTTCVLSPYRWRGEWGRPPGPGDYIRSCGGSVYEILAARPIAGDPNKLRLSVVRTDPATVPAGAVVYGLVWDKRTRKKGAPMLA